jgi:hypothetical protein
MRSPGWLCMRSLDDASNVLPYRMTFPLYIVCY